jgi:DNA-binding phage protein
MFQSVTFGRLNGGDLFLADAHRRAFLERAQRLGARWGVQTLAFRLDGRTATLLSSGGGAGLEHWMRLMQSGHGVYMHHHASVRVLWRPPVVRSVRDSMDARRLLTTLHAGSLSRPWSSLWEGVGLRRAAFFDGAWVRQQGDPREHLVRIGWHGPVPRTDQLQAFRCSQPLLDQAVLDATGQPAWRREHATLRVQVADACGWSVDAIAMARGISRPAVRKALRRPPCPALGMVLAHLRTTDLRLAVLARVEGEIFEEASGAMPAWEPPAHLAL